MGAVHQQTEVVWPHHTVQAAPSKLASAFATCPLAPSIPIQAQFVTAQAQASQLNTKSFVAQCETCAGEVTLNYMLCLDGEVALNYLLCLDGSATYMSVVQPRVGVIAEHQHGSCTSCRAAVTCSSHPVVEDRREYGQSPLHVFPGNCIC